MSFRNKLESLGISLKRSSGSVKTICPKCSSERKNKRDYCLSVNIDTGQYNCHHCGWKGSVKEYAPQKEFRKLDRSEYMKEAKITDSRAYLNERGLSDLTIDHFMIYEKVQKFVDKESGEWKSKKCIAFPYFRDADLINVQYRSRDKDFRLEKDAELIFYNINSLNGVKKCIITEGQIDCMSAFECGFGDRRNKEKLNELITSGIESKRAEMLEDNEFNRKQKKTGYSADDLKNISDDEIIFTDEMNMLSYLSDWGVVSVPNGASVNLEFLDNCADYFFGIDEIIIATDGDTKGIEMRDALILRFGAERCKYIDYSKTGCKDFNEVLIKQGKDAVISLIKTAVGVHISGVHFVDDMIDDMWASYHTKARMGTTTGVIGIDDLFVWKIGEVNCWYGYANHGKALCIETDIPTLDGWKKMKDIQIGDIIFDENGNRCSVTNATNIMYDRNCYKITFSDNSTVIADEEHLWFTHTVASRLSEKNKNKRDKTRSTEHRNQEHKRVLPQVRTTKDILNSLYSRSNSKRANHSIDLAKAINRDSVKLPIEPYLFGVWVGDGCSSDGRIACDDIQIIKDIENLGYKVTKNKAQFMYQVHGIIPILREMDVLSNKHIPNIYLYASIEQRMELLMGLMDTDGYIDNGGICEFTTIKYNLSKQVYELITSLGIKASIYEGDATINGKIISKKYRIQFKPNVCVFKLKRKADRHKDKCKNNCRYISNIEKVDSVPVRCIQVDSPNSLYLCTKSYIPTHNTTFLNFLMVCKVALEGWKFAIFSPENYPSTDFYNSLIEIYIGKQIHPKSEQYKMSEAEYLKGINFIKDNFFFVYPENEHDLESVHEKFKYLILKKGVNAVVVDPFNQLDKTGSAFQRDDQYLSVVFAKVKRFALSYQISYNIVAHPNKPQSTEKGKPLPIPTYYDLNGGALWANKMDNMYCFYKEQVNQPQFRLIVGKNKKRSTGGGLLGDFVDGIYRWEDNRFYVNDQNPLTDADKEMRASYGQQVLGNIFDKQDDDGYVDSNDTAPPF